MSWRDNLRKASFRGVEFHYDDVTRGVGRRIKRHEYPGGEIPYHEDLGADTETINITAFVLQPDHITKAQQLSEAIAEPGPGTLVHPYYGEITAVALPATETYTTSDGGMARFSLRFERAGANRFPRASTNTASLLSDRASAIDDQAIIDFTDKFNVDGAPGWVADSAENDMGTVLDGVGATATPTLSDALDTAAYVRDLATMKFDAANLVRDPASLASRLASAVGRTGGIGPALELASSAFSLGAIAATTPSRLLQSNNRRALVDLVNNAGIAASVRNMAAATFDTSADAYAARDAITERVDTQSLTASDGMVRALSSGLSSVTRHVSKIAPSLARLVEIRPTMTRPAIVHSYALYGDDLSTVIGKADEITKRNRLRHPGFVPAADSLEVLGT